MKCFNHFIILLVCFASLSTANAQQPFLLKAYAMSIDSSKTIPLANVLNKNTNQKFIGSRLGLFKAMISLNDTLIITAIGYDTQVIPVVTIAPENKNDTIQIYMRPKAYALKDVTFVYSNKKRDSIALRAAEYLSSDPLLNNYDRVLNRNQGGIMSPLTALWNEYSKAGQDMKRFEEFVRHAEMLKQVNTRYNKKTIKRATGLDDEYLDDYILYCNINRNFVLNSSDYDLILEMRQCADRFKAAKGIRD
jgi:hypothetical protein